VSLLSRGERERHKQARSERREKQNPRSQREGEYPLRSLWNFQSKRENRRELEKKREGNSFVCMLGEEDHITHKPALSQKGGGKQGGKEGNV